jgi:hypothetical protein
MGWFTILKMFEITFHIPAIYFGLQEENCSPLSVTQIFNYSNWLLIYGLSGLMICLCSIVITINGLSASLLTRLETFWEEPVFILGLMLFEFILFIFGSVLFWKTIKPSDCMMYAIGRFGIALWWTQFIIQVSYLVGIFFFCFEKSLTYRRADAYQNIDDA